MSVRCEGEGEGVPTCPALASCLGSVAGSRMSERPRSLSTHSPPTSRTSMFAVFTSLWATGYFSVVDGGEEGMDEEGRSHCQSAPLPGGPVAGRSCCRAALTCHDAGRVGVVLRMEVCQATGGAGDHAACLGP